MKLNTKMVTRVTFRVYDVEFGEKLDQLLVKTQMNQQDFFTLLIHEGYNAVAPRYSDIPLSVNSNVTGVKEEQFNASVKELKDLIIACHQTETRKLSDIDVTNKDLMAIISCVYKIFLNSQDLDVQEDIEKGLFDGIPLRFKRVRTVDK